MAFQDRDTLVGQNNTSGGSSDRAANDWQAKPLAHRHASCDDGDPGAELAEHVAERARVDLSCGHRYLKPTEKSCPHRLTAVLLPGDPA